MILGITGHRPPGLDCSYDIPNPTYEKVYYSIQKKFHELSPTKIISGMALGVDQWAASAAIELNIPVIAAVPCDNQSSKWPEKSQRIYKMIIESCAEVIIVSPGPYSPEKMHLRDRWIVDNSNSLLAVWNGITHGGTFGTIRYAQKLNKPNYNIHIINPKTL